MRGPAGSAGPTQSLEFDVVGIKELATLQAATRQNKAPKNPGFELDSPVDELPPYRQVTSHAASIVVHLPRSFLGRMRRPPQGPRVDAIGIQFKHPVVQFQRRFGFTVYALKGSDVFACCVDMTGATVSIERAMACHNCFRFQCLDFVDRGQPRAAAVCV